MHVVSVRPSVGDYFTVRARMHAVQAPLARVAWRHAEAGCALVLSQYRQSNSDATAIYVFYSTTCTISDVVIRQSALNAITDQWGGGGNTYQ